MALKRVATLLGAIAVAINLSACEDTDKVVGAINNAVSLISQNSDFWRADLADLEQQLKGTGDKWIAEVRSISLDAGNNVGDQAKCEVSYIGDYVVGRLTALQAHILGKQPPHRQPVICTTAPSGALRMGEVERGLVTDVKFDGYNLDSGFGLAWMDAHKALHQVPAAFVSESTQYLAVIPIGGANGFKIPRQAEALVYTENGQPLGSGERLPLEWPESPPPPPPPVVMTPLSLTFHTTNEDKDGDSILTVSLAASNGFQLASWEQQGNLGFANNSVHTVNLVPNQTTLPSLQDSKLSVCIAPNGHDTWHFDLEFATSYASGPFSGQTVKVFAPGQSLYQGHPANCASYALFALGKSEHLSPFQTEHGAAGAGLTDVHTNTP